MGASLFTRHKAQIFSRLNTEAGEKAESALPLSFWGRLLREATHKICTTL